MKINRNLNVLLLILVFFVSCNFKDRQLVTKTSEKVIKEKKVFYINSYHKGYEWSDGITAGINEVFKNHPINMKTFFMDSKRNTNREFIFSKALDAKKQILKFEPDLIIASDDHAFKFVIMPYFKNSSIPVVFCGLNWDASIYGAPYKNTTGMVEVALIPKLIAYLKKYSKGRRIGYIAADVTTARKEGEYYKKYFNLKMLERHVKTLSEWKKEFLFLQKKVDMIIVGNIAGINDWEKELMIKFISNNTRIPTGTIYTFMIPYALLAFAKSEIEQGKWSAEAAVKILNGTKIADIPVVQNKRGILMLNFKIAKTMNIKFPPNLIKIAEVYK